MMEFTSKPFAALSIKIKMKIEKKISKKKKNWTTLKKCLPAAAFYTSFRLKSSLDEKL